jgi:hypothetical protein
LGNLEGSPFTGDFERWMEGSRSAAALALRELCEGNLEWGVHLVGTLMDIKIKAMETAVCIHSCHLGALAGGLIYQGL